MLQSLCAFDFNLQTKDSISCFSQSSSQYSRRFHFAARPWSCAPWHRPHWGGIHRPYTTDFAFRESKFSGNLIRISTSFVINLFEEWAGYAAKARSFDLNENRIDFLKHSPSSWNCEQASSKWRAESTWRSKGLTAFPRHRECFN